MTDSWRNALGYDDPRDAYRDPAMEMQPRYGLLPIDPLPAPRPRVEFTLPSGAVPGQRDPFIGQATKYVGPNAVAEGAYGLGQMGATAALDAQRGQYDPETLLPLAAMALPVPGAKAPPRIANPIKAYHGSRTDFDKFTDRWPTFVSEDAAHADMYRSGASDRPTR